MALLRKEVLLSIFATFSLAFAFPEENKLMQNAITEREIPTMTVPETIKYWGYPFEEHFTTTGDGYILGIHRIPHGRDEVRSGASKQPVLLGHGMLSSSSQWVFGPANKSLGYLLADEGYDVWMVNTRGNIYSRNHTSLDTCSSCPDFWSFCWHEGGIHDYSAIIDYVLETTEKENLFFVGHSMGSTQYLVLLSERPEYNQKIKAGFLLAPAAFMTHAYNPIFLLSEWVEELEDLFHLFGIYEFLPQPGLISWLAHVICNEEEHPIYTDVCSNIAFLLLGINPAQLNQTMIPVYLDHLPAGVSTRTLVHYAQLHLNNDQFAWYDYGSPEENLEHYGSEIPPIYNLSQVTAPTAIYTGDRDDLATVTDGEKLASILPNVIHYELVDLPGCSHFDFAIGIDITDLLYIPMMKMMSEI